MKPRLIDTHCHLHFPAYANTLSDVLKRLKENEMWAITVGTTAKTSEAGIKFAHKHDGIFATVGYHPEHLTSSFHDENEGATEPFDFAKLHKLAQDKKVVAIGETGLDFFRIDPERDRTAAIKMQEEVFRQHVALAHECGKPLAIHCREATDQLLEIVRDERSKGKTVNGVMHCFSGTWDEAQRILEAGLHISFTGLITFSTKKFGTEQQVQRAVERMPMDKLMVETDAPWLAPEPYRGKQNEPSYVEFIARKVAELRKMEFEEVVRITTENAIKFFNLPAA